MAVEKKKKKKKKRVIKTTLSVKWDIPEWNQSLSFSLLCYGVGYGHRKDQRASVYSV